ncbi:hypothetical protein BCR44DRAFT_1048116 [Catenaria anguillulae PL171]|uniref:ENTH domain-containing protein n=1 Tax=Catenaria anguillulae PL171 TaxID=765915 RepID=A0A1Y2H525_9FUNG|nr:hypothetical protein BCR44DRAFT_1048116 [Catenaria anguillulae PL171]
MSYAARGALRSVKNVAKGYTEIQAKVREATSNDPGPVNTELMRQIASASHYDQQFVEIMIILEKRLNDDGRNWRHVYKALVLLEFLILRGSDRILQYARDNFYVVKTLKEFQFRDEAGVDHGQNVRQKAVKISELLSNDELLQRERAARKDVDDRVSGRLDYYEGRESPYATGGSSSPGRGRQPDAAVAASREEEDVRRAIEESLKTAERERSIRSGYSGSGAGSGVPRSQSVPRNVPMSNEMSEEEQLQRAIEMSKRDEEERQRRRGGTGTSTGYSSSPVTVNRNNAPAPLIDLLGGEDHTILPTQPTGGAMLPIQPTGASDPFALPQGNPFTMLAAQPTGYTAVSSQMTGYSAGGSDPFAMSGARSSRPCRPCQRATRLALPVALQHLNQPAHRLPHK